MSNAAGLSKAFIRPATLKDIKELARTMRPEDRAEIRLSSGATPLVALTKGFVLSSSCSAVVRDGKVMAVFGVVGIAGVSGSPWMLGAPGIEQCKSLLRECRKLLQGYLADYSYLSNACWAGNLVHIRWIKWLGFTFSGSDFRSGELFLHFHKDSHV